MKIYKGTAAVTAVAIALMAAAIASVLWYQHDIVRRAERDAYRTLQGSAAEQALLFKTLIDGQFQILSVIAQSVSPADDKNSGRLTADMERLAGGTGFKRLVAIGADGRACTSDGHRLDASWSVSLKSCLRGEHSLVKVESGTIDNIPIFVFSVPLKDKGRNVGALLGVYDESNFIDTIISKAYGEAAYSFICDSAGKIIVRSRHGAFIGQSRSIFTTLDKTDLAGTEKIRTVEDDLKNSRAGGLAYEFSGSRRYAVYQPLHINGWTIFNVVPEAAARGAIANISSQGVFLVVVITLIAIAFAAIVVVIERRGYSQLLKKNAQLTESEERFRVVMENTTLSVWDYDLKTKEIIQTGQSIALHGFAAVVPGVPESLIESGFVHPDSAAAFLALYDRLFRGEKNPEGVFLVRNAARDGWWYEHIQYRTLFDQKGRPYRAIGMSMDVTEKRELERSYQLELQYQQSLADDVYLMAVFDVSAEKQERLECKDAMECERLASKPLCDFFAAESRRVVSNRKAQEFFDSLDYENLKLKAVAAENDFEREYPRRLPDGRIIWVRSTLHLLVDPATNHLMLFIYMKDIDEQRQKEETLLRAAETDTLTGLLNHAATMKHITESLENESRDAIQALFAIDLDRFKQINDTIGHQAGDEALHAAGRTIRKTFRAGDVCGRTGGDEFLALMKNVPSLEVVRRKAEELQLALQIHCSGGQAAVSLSGSTGVAIRRPGESVVSLYARADKALYKAKAQGRNGYYIDAEGADIKPEKSGGRAAGADSYYSIQLQTLLQYMEGGVLIVEIGERMRALYISPSFYSASGLKPEDTTDGGRELLSMIHPDDRDEFERRLRHGAQTYEHVDFSYRITDARGTPAWRRLRAQRIDYAGSPFPVMLIVTTDITEIKKTAALFDAVMRSSPDGIGVFELTPVLKPVLANAALLRLAGLTREEFFEKSGDELLDIAAPEDRALLLSELDAALKSGRLAKAAFHVAAEGEDGPRRVSASGVRIDGVGESPLLLVMFAEASGGEKGPEPTTK